MVISIHAARAGRDGRREGGGPPWKEFQSTRPVRAATRLPQPPPIKTNRFQSTRPVRAATLKRSMEQHTTKRFQSTRPVRAATPALPPVPPATQFQSTRPVRAATGIPRSPHPRPKFQSTRPVRAATVAPHQGRRIALISIHAARAGRDTKSRPDVLPRPGFQSTRPVRAATRADGHTCVIVGDFNPRGPCGPRPGEEVGAWEKRYFNPRGPCGPRPGSMAQRREEQNFNPRGPCGPRPTHSRKRSGKITFQSTRPVRAATAQSIRAVRRGGISIHAARAGRDGFRVDVLMVRGNFNPRGPCGPRPCCAPFVLRLKVFQSTRPVRAATLAPAVGRLAGRNFNPRGPCGPRPPLSLFLEVY